MPNNLFTNDTSADYEYSAIFEGSEYIMGMTWNETSSSWYLTIKSYEGDVLIQGVRVVTGLNLVGRHVGSGVPAGIFFVKQNQADSLVSPTRDSFSTGSHSFYYYSVSEVNEIFA